MSERTNVFIVDDNRNDAELEVEVLRRSGMLIESRVAVDERELRAKLPDFRPDVILCDFSFPGFDGLSALEIAREIHREVPVIFVSGTISEELAVTALRSGAIDYVLKSNLVRLPAAVARAVRETRATLELRASLQAAQAGLQRHARRLEILWRIANDPTLHGADRIRAMLRESAAAIRPNQTFRGVISRFDGESLLVVHLSVEDAAMTPELLYPVGTRLPIQTTIASRAERTTTFDEVTPEELPETPATLSWRSIITTRFRAGETEYVLTYGSTTPTAFDPEDRAYVEVLAASFGHQFEHDDLVATLSDSEARARLHGERLESLWRIVNKPNLSDDDMWLEMLQQSAQEIRPGQSYHGRFLRVEGDRFIREAVVLPPGYVPSSDERDADAERSFPLAGTVAGKLVEVGGTIAWDDLRDGAGDTHGAQVRGWRAAIGTSFSAGGSVYVLVFAATQPTTEPFGPLEIAYIDVLASFFARHVQERWQFERIAYQQSHDVLTGLLNRSQFRSRARARARTDERFAIVLADVVALRDINETYGHMIGDALLVEVGSALQERAGEDEIVGRIAGDVFGIYIPNHDPGRLGERAKHFAEAFATPFSTGDREGREFIGLTASFGVAAAPQDGRSIDEILSHADAALFAAKTRGPGSIAHFEAGMEGDSQRRATLRNDLLAALTADEFVLYFQPHVDVHTGGVSGAEALIRWQHPTRGLLLPGTFIPFAEQSGIIAAIDSWVMSAAFRASGELRRRWPEFRLYFNLSGRQAGDASLVRAFVRAARAGTALHNLGVEITETDAMRDVEATRRVCRALRRLGVRIAIDDFGTGYSSLSSLKRLPVDIVKIDRAFISGVTTDAQDETIAETIMDITKRFGFASLAEGVEKQAEIDWLRERSCRVAQGYAYSRPLPMDAFTAWLEERTASAR